ncbi:MAG: arginine--tRNA ligase [Candidatus Omnitrophica bacterium]|nr:arginine--tRNA ligase [Candidatus Omnitrophota bacterium]MBD3269595.1 arginine--tRNA ligase [Candidatus Omnitrophota bacterium]
MKGFYDKFPRVLKNALENIYGIIAEPPLWELSSRREFGDLSSMVALKLASRIKKNPMEIAAELKPYLEKNLKGFSEKIDILKPGFINVFLSKDSLIESLNSVLTEKDCFFKNKGKRKVLIEFLSANPTGPLTVAHGRQAVVGDVIANILEFWGDEVEREYYLNDTGRQIDLFRESVKKAVDAKDRGSEYVAPEGGYRGDYIKEIAHRYLHNGINSDILEYSLSEMISSIKEDVKNLGIKFDSWFSQNNLVEKGKVEEAIDFLSEKGLIYEKDEALWFSATAFGDDKDRVIKKSDGELTYFASDIAYHKDKIERGYDKLIDLWGPDHHGYIKRVKTALKAMGYEEEILEVVIIQLVSLKSKERMSKRAGTAISLSQLIKELGKDTTRFYYLTRKNDSHLEFDMDLARQATFNNPLYYIQYVCARIESIFRKAGKYESDPRYSNLLSEEEEINLLRSLVRFPYYLEKAYCSLEPVFIIEFLKDLSSAFHKFYECQRVLVEDSSVMKARLNLLKSLKITLHCALGILGIRPVEEM